MEIMEEPIQEDLDTEMEEALEMEDTHQ